ncbi:MAG: MFS transporter [Nocardiaceae bacterium]|nr:MFS transporter [Nocardiaceae bacterium]
MYLSTVSRPVSENGGRVHSRVAANVFALGTVSLVTDISSEMVTAILPVYLVVGLHLSPAAYGVLDGLYTGATALLRIVGGLVADRTQRRKLVAGVGYATSALMKPALLLVGPSAAGIGAVIAFDRAGKGLRSAPRDALITLSSAPEGLGRAFGVHRAMDSAGAFLGPLVALGVLAMSGQSFDAVFVASFCIATLAVVLLGLYVRDQRDPLAPSGTVSLRSFRALVADPAVRRIILAASVLGLVTVGDGFIYLLLQKREDLSIAWFPLLAVGTNLAYLLLAAPFGALADRVGRVRVMLGGYVALALVYLLLFGPLTGWPMLVATLFLHGVFYAATDGVLMALAGPLLPERMRTTGIAMIQTAQALCYLVSSVAFGLAWQLWGAVHACQVAAAAVAITIGMSALLLRRRVD